MTHHFNWFVCLFGLSTAELSDNPETRDQKCICGIIISLDHGPFTSNYAAYASINVNHVAPPPSDPQNSDAKKYLYFYHL